MSCFCVKVKVKNWDKLLAVLERIAVALESGGRVPTTMVLRVGAPTQEI